MNGQPKRWKRRQYIVNPGFQYRFMGYIGGAMLLGFAVIYGTNLWYLDVLVSQGQELGLDPQHVYFEYIEHQRMLMNLSFIGILLVVFSGLMVGALLLSHKIAGPIYRVEKYTREVLDGESSLAPVTLRKGDFFPEIATIVNSLIAHYSGGAGGARADAAPGDDGS